MLDPNDVGQDNQWPTGVEQLPAKFATAMNVGNSGGRLTGDAQ